MTETTLITEAELATIESRVRAARLTFRELMGYGFRLLDEVRRLNGIIPGLLDKARVEQMEVDVRYKNACIENIANELFSANVEIDNLRKQLEDRREERDDLRCERDVLKSMVDTSNDREQIQITIATQAIKDRDAALGKISELYELVESMWQAATLFEAHQHVVAWRDRQKLSPPHPLDKLVDETLEGGTPT